MPRKKTRNKPKSIRDLRRRRVAARNLITMPIEIDEEDYVLYSRRLSLGAARAFIDLRRMDKDDPEYGARSINVAANFLRSHIRDEDGSELDDEEIDAIIDSLDLEFAGELAKSMVEYTMGALNESDDDSDTSGDSNDAPDRPKKVLESAVAASP